MSLPDVSRKNFYGEDWNRDYFWSTAVFTEIEHQLGDGWKTKLALRHADNNYDLTQAYARNGGGIDPADNLVSMNSIMFDYREKQDEVDLYADGPFSLFGREHKLLVGTNYSRSEFSSNGGYFSNFLGDVDLYDPQANFAYPEFPDDDRLPTSVANSRASSWNRAPIDRMANLNVEPGDQPLDRLIGQIEHGILMSTNRSWSIDDARNKFQFGCEWGQLIENGELKGVVKNPNYRGISAQFWNNLSAVGDSSTFKVLGTPNCGKGEPNQVIRVGHASPACVFSNVDVFGGDA